MVIIPFDKKLDWKNPPLITLLLIVANVFIYFSFQFHDDEKEIKAQHFYYRSGLSEIEMPRFKEVLIEQDDREFLQDWGSYYQKEQGPWFFYMQSNKPFMQALMNEQIITPSDPNYASWKSKRTQLNELISKSVTISYSLKAGEPTAFTIISHMFLHGDISHLLGNMLFLLAVGFIVELAMNRYLYLASYLIAGVGSALFYIPSASDSLIPSIGASGAIAGLMGMYAVLFNTRKVRFFYFIGVYFDYVKLPALYLFALWLGYEVFKQISYAHISNVNYLAHIGGLISGASIAFLLSKFQTTRLNQDYLNENNDAEQFSQKFRQAQEYIRELHFEKAKPLLTQLLQQHPDNHELLAMYYRISKVDSGSEAHHKAATSILSLSEDDQATDQFVINTFNEYSKVPKARLTVSLLNNIMKRCITNEAFDGAEKLAALMQKQPDKFAHLPQHLRALINKLVRSGQHRKAKTYAHYLQTNFPDHQETQIAQSLVS